jgi:hypothetical protein
MTLFFGFNTNNAEDLRKFLALIQERGFDKFLKRATPKKTATPQKRVWKNLGIGNL